MSKFKYVSLFSGIGGFETALNRLGGECVLASEIDKYANKAYEVLYGHATVGDVTKINAEDVPDHDLLVGGFPCQAFSVAGKRLGFEDTRGTLFFEIARIARVKRPKALLLENVKGLLSHDNGRTLDTIILTLAQMGYTIDFNVLNSKYFGVPQNRERIFIVAVRDIPTQTWSIPSKLDVVAKAKKRISRLEDVKTFNFDWPINNVVTTRLLDVLETDVADKYYLSDEKTATLLQKLKEEQSIKNGTVLDAKNGFGGVKTFDDVSPTLLSNDWKEPKKVVQFSVDGEGIAYCVDCSYRYGLAPSGVGKAKKTHIIETEPDLRMVGLLDMPGNDSIRRVYDPTGCSPTGCSPTLTTMGGGHREPKICVQMNRHEIKKEVDVSHCLMARDYKGFGNQEMTGIVEECRAVLTPDRIEKRQNGHQWRIRKLTPLECFRLQGFPDEYHAALVSAGISDSQLYKMAGNAVTVNVVQAIGEKLLNYIVEYGEQKEAA